MSLHPDKSEVGRMEDEVWKEGRRWMGSRSIRNSLGGLLWKGLLYGRDEA